MKYMRKWSVWTSNHWPADGCFNNDRLKVVIKAVQPKRLKAKEEDKHKIALRLWQAEIENRAEKKKREEAEKLVSQTLNTLITKEQSGGTCE